MYKTLTEIYISFSYITSISSATFLRVIRESIAFFSIYLCASGSASENRETRTHFALSMIRMS